MIQDKIITDNVVPWDGPLRKSMLTFKKTGGKQNFVHRHFLNSPESAHSGSAKLDVTVQRKGTKAKGYRWTIWGSMELRDCSRRIDLTFDGDTKKDRDELQNSRAKLERLKSICETGLAVIDAMEEAAK